MSENELDQLVVERLKEMLEEKPLKLLQFFVLHLGTEAVKANAATFDISLEATIEGQLYKIKTRTLAKKI